MNFLNYYGLEFINRMKIQINDKSLRREMEMEFTFYEQKNLDDFENQLKKLALNKRYKFNKEVEVLKEDEILENSSSHNRALLKVFKDNAQITTYHFKSHKSNYLIIIGDTKQPNVVGLTVIFDKKPFKQTGKFALGTLLAVSAAMSGGSILVALAGFGVMSSYLRRTLAIKGPLGKDISQIIENKMGKPVEIKS